MLAGGLAAIGGAPLRSMVLVVIAVLATALAVKLGKMLTRRARPGRRLGRLLPPVGSARVPSGHAARAALLVGPRVRARAAGPRVLAAVWALLVAASRVALGVHHVSDVVAGLVLGLCLRGDRRQCVRIAQFERSRNRVGV